MHKTPTEEQNISKNGW